MTAVSPYLLAALVLRHDPAWRVKCEHLRVVPNANRLKEVGSDLLGYVDILEGVPVPADLERAGIRPAVRR